MPAHHKSAHPYKSAHRFAYLLLCLGLMIQIVANLGLAPQIEAQPKLPATAEVVAVNIEARWEGVPEENIPDTLTFTVVPDGIAFMASSMMLTAENDWQGSLAVHSGTRALQFKQTEVQGFDHRILGSMEEGFVLEYYLPGNIPDDGAQVADQDLPVGSIELAEVPTQTVKLKEDTPSPIVETREGESLSEEEYKERLIQAHLQEQGYIVNKTPYYIGIGVCVALIVVVIVLRILLGRS